MQDKLVWKYSGTSEPVGAGGVGSEVVLRDSIGGESKAV
jgi:hypothetical protein